MARVQVWCVMLGVLMLPALAHGQSDAEKAQKRAEILEKTVVKLIEKVQQLESRLADLEQVKKVADEQPKDPINATGKFLGDVVGGTLNMAGQTLDGAGRLLTGQPQRKPETTAQKLKQAAKEDQKQKGKGKTDGPSFFGIPIE